MIVCECLQPSYDFYGRCEICGYPEDEFMDDWEDDSFMDEEDDEDDWTLTQEVLFGRTRTRPGIRDRWGST